MHQALYRKYRPKSFDDVVGQEHITRTLQNEISAGRPAHAYLFTGSRGTGKTTCSKIIAKAVNCPHQDDGNPCGLCDICRGVDDGSLMDVTEIDAATNTSVDNVRQLREEAQFTPATGKYRVYIIDEVHMLSSGAFNALLKIMEEPPAHVIFILATTEVHKIPTTIISRCQRFDFKRIAPDIIAARLKAVSQNEGFVLQDDAAQLVAKLAEGGMRDALSLLDVCRSYSDDVTADIVAHAAGLMMEDTLFKIAESIHEGDLPKVTALLDEVNCTSVDYSSLTAQMLGHYRNLMLIKASGGKTEVTDVVGQQAEKYREQQAKFTLEYILYCLSVLQETVTALSRSQQPRIDLEMAVVKMSDITLDSSPKALLARVAKLEGDIKSGKVLVQPQAEKTAQGEQPKAESSQAVYQDKPVTDLAKIVPFTKWGEVLIKLQKKNAALAGALAKSEAFLYNDLVLIKSDGEMFLNMIRTSDFAKQSIHESIIEVTGKKHRLGPYRSDKYEIVQEKSDPLDELISKVEASNDVDFSVR